MNAKLTLNTQRILSACTGTIPTDGEFRVWGFANLPKWKRTISIIALSSVSVSLKLVAHFSSGLGEVKKRNIAPRGEGGQSIFSPNLPGPQITWNLNTYTEK